DEVERENIVKMLIAEVGHAFVEVGKEKPIEPIDESAPSYVATDDIAPLLFQGCANCSGTRAEIERTGFVRNELHDARARTVEVELGGICLVLTSGSAIEAAVVEYAHALKSRLHSGFHNVLGVTDAVHAADLVAIISWDRNFLDPHAGKNHLNDDFCIKMK